MLNKLVASHFAVFCKIFITGFIVNEGTRDGCDKLTVHCELVAAQIFTGESNGALADKCVAFVVEVIGVAFNLKPLVLVVSERVVVSSAFNTVYHIGVPTAENLTLLAFNLVYTVFGKGEGAYGSVTRFVVEIVGVAVNYNEALLLEVRHEVHPTVAVVIEAGISEIGLIYAVFVKGAHDAVDKELTGYLNAVDKVIGILKPTVCNHNAVNVGLTVGIFAVEKLITAFASKLTVSVYYVIVAVCGNDGTPIENCAAAFMSVTFMTLLFHGHTRTTDTEYTADITLFGTSSSLILCNACGMEMPAALIILKEVFLLPIGGNAPPTTDLTLGINLDLVTGEHLGSVIGKFNKTCQGINNDIVIVPYKFIPTFVRVVHTVSVQIVIAADRRNVSGILIFLELPSLNGNGNKHIFTGCFYVTGTFNCNIRNVFFCNIRGIGCGKTIQGNHAV